MTRERWRLAWAIWFVAVVIVAAGSFAVLETLAWQDGLTLSRVTAELPKPIVFLLGFAGGGLTGGLAVHFWWHWDPTNPDDRRG